MNPIVDDALSRRYHELVDMQFEARLETIDRDPLLEERDRE
jgi:hypothetical protein